VARSAGVDRFDLIGHSLGAAIAIQLAASSADLVRSLIVVAGFSRGAEPRLKLQFELWLDLLRTNRDAFLRLLLLSGLTPTFVSSVGISTIEDMIKGYVPLANWEGIARQVELDLAVDVSGQAGSVTSPTLVINCAYDQIVTQTPELAAIIPGSMCRQISAGHLAYFEGADEFLSLATEFLRRHDS
jgi:3-oxoadipate enol-lactonase